MQRDDPSRHGEASGTTARETVGPLRKKHIASQGFRIVRICGFHRIGDGKFLYLIRKKVVFGNVQPLPCKRAVRIALEKRFRSSSVAIGSSDR